MMILMGMLCRAKLIIMIISGCLSRWTATTLKRLHRKWLWTLLHQEGQKIKSGLFGWDNFILISAQTNLNINVMSLKRHFYFSKSNHIDPANRFQTRKSKFRSDDLILTNLMKLKCIFISGQTTEGEEDPGGENQGDSKSKTSPQANRHNSQAITPFHFFDYSIYSNSYHEITFLSV